MKIGRVYIATDPEKEYSFEFDKRNKKRPSWLKSKDLPKGTVFLKLVINNEDFWYRKYLGEYFFPLLNNPQDYENFYDRIFNEYEDIVPHNKKLALLILKKLEELKISKGSSILEIGAGTGLVADTIAKKFKNLTLFDISKKSLEAAKKKKNLKKCKFIKGSILEYNFKEKYDVVYACMGLGYFNIFETEFILNKIKRILKKKGIFIYLDRHSFNFKLFKKIKQRSFIIETKKCPLRYEYFIGKK